MLPYVTIPKFSAESGYTEEAVRKKIERGEWLEGRVWRKGPDGRVLIIVEGFVKWVEGQVEAPVQQRRRA
jgi:hypothetical protein